MKYCDWTLTIHQSWLGFAAQYTSPTGQSYQTAPSFATSQQALSYARGMVDTFRDWQQARFQQTTGAALAGRLG